ncbi:MAG: hypothetical protein F6K47_11065 [Symploca sp. SIO2E6]|nr:hypothetical protein [Symploca sp. SIO2E6]
MRAIATEQLVTREKSWRCPKQGNELTKKLFKFTPEIGNWELGIGNISLVFLLFMIPNPGFFPHLPCLPCFPYYFLL